MDLIVGCGYIGRRLAAALPDHKHVYGLVRSSTSAEQLREQQIKPIITDLDRLETIDLPTAIKRIFYLAPPPADGNHDHRMARFLSQLEDQSPEKILYISTTGVYGDCAGNWVDESTDLNPAAPRAFRRHDAELQIQAFAQAHDSIMITLRVAGIYGPDKLPIQRLVQQKPMIAAEVAPWTNRIHADDLVQVCIASMNKMNDSSIFNVSDGQPGKMTDYFNQVADKCKLPRPPIIAEASVQDQLSAGMRSYLVESRKIDNQKMLHELGITMKCPNLETGLKHCGLGK